MEAFMVSSFGAFVMSLDDLSVADGRYQRQTLLASLQLDSLTNLSIDPGFQQRRRGKAGKTLHRCIDFADCCTTRPPLRTNSV